MKVMVRNKSNAKFGIREINNLNELMELIKNLEALNKYSDLAIISDDYSWMLRYDSAKAVKKEKVALIIEVYS